TYTLLLHDALPIFPSFAAPVAAGLQKADRCPCSASAVSSAGRASASQSLGTKFAAEPCTRPGGLAHSQRQISLYVSRPSAHVGWTGLFMFFFMYRSERFQLLVEGHHGADLVPADKGGRPALRLGAAPEGGLVAQTQGAAVRKTEGAHPG